MNASDLTRRANLLKPVQEVDADGMVIQGWQVQFTALAHVRFLRGSETVMQARLASKAPVIITLRDCADARQITSEWRAEIEGVTYDLKEDPRPEGAFLEMLAEA